MPEDQQQRPGRGCFFYGCLTFLILLVAVAVGTYFGTRKAVRMAVDSYLHTNSVPLPGINLTEAQQKQSLARFEGAVDSSRRGLPTPPLELTTDELNAVLRKSGALGPIREQAYFRVETNQLKADISIPLDQFQIWRSLGKKLVLGNLQGRYLNGTAHLSISMVNGALDLKVTDIVVNGKALPNTFMGNLRAQNLATGAAENKQAADIVQHIEKVEIREDRILLHLKQPAKE